MQANEKEKAKGLLGTATGAIGGAAAAVGGVAMAGLHGASNYVPSAVGGDKLAEMTKKDAENVVRCRSAIVSADSRQEENKQEAKDKASEAADAASDAKDVRFGPPATRLIVQEGKAAASDAKDSKS